MRKKIKCKSDERFFFFPAGRNLNEMSKKCQSYPKSKKS